MNKNETAKTIKLAAFARFGDEIRVFPMYGPTPTVCDYADVLASFPATSAGQREAERFVDAFCVERGAWSK